MSRPVDITFAVVLVVTLAQQTAAQNVSAQKQSRTEQAPTRDRVPTAHRRALALLDQVLQTSASFEDTALRLKIQSDAADLLWRYDEPRARKMYEASFLDIDTIKPRSDEGMEANFLRTFKMGLRAEILRRLSLHDKDFAAKLSKSAAVERPPEGQTVTRCVGCGVQGAEVTSTMRLALDIAHTDPQRAVQLAKGELSKGINALLWPVLQVLRRRQPALADELFSHAVTVARQHTVYLSDSVNQLVRYVFPNFGTGAIKLTPPQPVPTEPKPELIEQLLSFVSDAVEREAVTLQVRGRDASDSQFGRRVSFDYFLGELLLPYFERYMPDRAAAVRARIEDIIAVIPPDEAKPYLDDFKRERTGSFIAEKADAEKDIERRQSRYMEAAFQANARREYDEALAILQKIEDNSIRAFVESTVRHDMALATLNEDPQATHKLTGDVPDPTKRASLLGKIASNRMHLNDAKGAAEALFEAEQTIEKAEPGLEKDVEMLYLVVAAASIDLDRGFEVMKSAVDALNGSELTHKFSTRTPLVSKSTGKVFMWVSAGLELLKFDLAYARLASEDFDRSLRLAETIQSREVLALARLALCKIAFSRQYGPQPEIIKLSAQPKQN